MIFMKQALFYVVGMVTEEEDMQMRKKPSYTMSST
jgi:hypothetical protein